MMGVLRGEKGDRIRRATSPQREGKLETHPVNQPVLLAWQRGTIGSIAKISKRNDLPPGADF